jgi:hypothetical protein
MRNIVENYNKNANFWELNPQFIAINPFKQLYKTDKSKDKKESSLIMWAIALAYHPKSDLYYIEDKEEKLAKDLVGIKKSDIDTFWNNNKFLVDAFIDAALSQAEKSLISWEKRLKQRDAFLAEQQYTFGYVDEEGVEYKDNTKAFDDMQSKTAKFYEEFFKIKKELQDEEILSRGKKEKSATAGGEL